MRERSVWRWWGPVLLLAFGLLLVAGLPTAALGAFFDHPAHPFRTTADGTARSLASAQWLRVAAVGAAVAWVAGALLLLRWRSDHDRPPNPPVPSQELFTVAAITILAAIVRAPFLFHSLWFDEIAAIGDFTKFGPGAILGSWFTPSNHAFQSLLTWASATFFGASEVALRLPSLVAGLFTVVAVHALGRRVGGPALGLTAALVLALMPIAVLESTEARGYALAILFSSIACWAFVRGTQSGEPWTWVVLAVCGALAAWSHFVASLVTAGFALVALARLVRLRSDAMERRRMGSALVGVVMAGALAAALLAPLIPDVIATRKQFAASGNDALGTPRLVSEEGLRLALTLSGTWAASAPKTVMTPPPPELPVVIQEPWALVMPPLLAALPGLLLVVIGGAVGWRTPISRVALAAAFAGLPLLVLLAASGSWAYARFATFIVPGVALAIGIGLVALARRWRRVGIAAAALLAASYVFELALLPPRQPIRDALDALALEANPGDRAVDLGIRGNVSAFYAPPNVTIVQGGVLGDALDARLADPRVRWAIVTYPRVLPRERRDALVAARFSRIREWPGWIDWGHGNVELWHRESSPSLPEGSAAPTSRPRRLPSP